MGTSLQTLTAPFAFQYVKHYWRNIEECIVASASEHQRLELFVEVSTYDKVRREIQGAHVIVERRQI